MTIFVKKQDKAPFGDTFGPFYPNKVKWEFSQKNPAPSVLTIIDPYHHA